MKKYFLYIFAMFFLNACTEGLHEKIVPAKLRLNNIETISVIDAKIEDGKTAWVQISYSNDIDNAFSSEPVYETKATIKIKSEKGFQEQLSYSGSKGIYMGKSLLGKVGETYTIELSFNGKTYSAKSTMLPTARFHSIEVNPVIYNKSGIDYQIYEEIWYIENDRNARNMYLFEWWTNGVHLKQQDWCIDDDRIPNGSKGIRIFNPRISPASNEHTEFRMAEVDLDTYKYFNMYEKIIRGLVSVADQTPYNPFSSFGSGTVGNFRAISFASYVALTPPDVNIKVSDKQANFNFIYNPLFTKFNLYWSNSAGVNKSSNKISNIPVTFALVSKVNYAFFSHKELKPGKYFYRLETEDAQGNTSLLSPEIAVSVL